MNDVARHHELRILDDRIAVIGLDTAEKSTNILSSEAISELIDSVSRVGAMTGILGLMFVSRKPKQFIAGANIDEILSMTVPVEASEKARFGQSLMQAIEDLPFPTIAVIDGPCLGGGLEFALACTYRVVGEGPHVKLGLPEVKLGIIPGFGGTQRLPKNVGLLPALDLILSGRSIDGRRAYKLGLADDIAPSPILENVARKWLRKGKERKRPARLPLWQRVIERISFLRKFALERARKRMIATTSGFYPAPVAALQVISETFRERDLNGFEMEARVVGEMVVTPISKALIRIFVSTEEIRKEKRAAIGKPLDKVGVIGAGVMGAGIAHLLSTRGKTVRLKDVSTSLLARGFKTICDLNEQDVRKRRCDVREAERRRARISFTTEWSGFARADFVIEAVVESMSIKKEVFRNLATKVRPDTILATNTSALSVSEIAASLPHPGRVIGLHFFNPVHRMPLIEVVRGNQSSETAVSTGIELALAIGRTPVVVADRPGFFVNRVLGLYLNEAMRAAEEGVPVEEIESAMKSFGMPMGPFELLDEIGFDIAEHVGVELSSAFPNFPRFSTLLSQFQKVGRLGKKSGRGFYIHGKKGKRLDDDFVRAVLKTLSKDRTWTMATHQYDLLVDRLILCMVNEATRCLAEGVVASPRDIDVATVLGIGFAPFRGGLFSYARSRGVEEITARLIELAERYGTHFDPHLGLAALEQPPSLQEPREEKTEEVQLSFS